MHSFAQSTQETFGKNRVQYKEFNWKFVSTTNFDIYFSDGGYDNAVLAAKYAELEYQRIIEMIDYSPYNRIKIIVYNSHNDLLQSNIQTPEENPALGGQTNFVKSKIEIPFEGNQLEFKRKIAEQITRFLITDMMYGGSLRNIYRNSIFLVLPEWYISGLAAYIARGWSKEMDDYMRDVFSHFKVKNPSAISAANQTLIGQSIWHFIAENQGKSAIANALTLTRISRNYEIGISSNVGMRYKKFEKAWRDYYRHNADITIETYTLVDASKALRKNRQLYDYYQVKSSPDGKLVAYSECNKGKYKVFVREVKSGKTYHFLTGGYKSIDQELNTKTPLLAWKSDRVLSVIETKNNKIHMTTREISGGYASRKVFGTFDQVLDFDYSDDGNTIVFSAEKEGKSDLFIFTAKSNQIKQITNDLYDDTHPVFIKGTNSFVFSSNRNTDTLQVGTLKLSALQDNTNLFVYDPSVSTTKVKRLTNTTFHESNPVSVSKDEVVYIQDETGIYNLSILDLKTGTTKQLTNFQQDMMHFDVSYNKNLSFVMQHKCRELLFVNYDVDFGHEVKKPIKTPRREAFNFIESIFNIGKADSVVDSSTAIVSQKTEQVKVSVSELTKVDTVTEVSHVNDQEITFGSNEVIVPKVENKDIVKTADAEKEIDVNNYTFESEQPSINNADDDNNQFGAGIATKYRSEESIKVSDYKPMRPMLNPIIRYHH
jgi:Tol biopolymer transport system component